MLAVKSLSTRSFTRVVATLIMVVTSLVYAQGQGVGSSRGLRSTSAGIHTIKGRVIFPDERPNARVKVRLEGANTFGGPSAVTDADGQFMFNGLEAGPYSVVVDGDNLYEPVREAVSIDREASPGARTIDVPIFLKLKPSANPAFASVPPSALQLYTNGLASARKGDVKKAAEQLKAAVAAHPNFAQAHNELGVQYLKLGEVDNAAAALESAVRLAPTDFHSRLNLGIALLNQKKFPESEQHLVEALKNNPTSSLAHMYLGMALMNQKKLEAAQKELETAVSSKSSEVGVAHKYLGGIYWGLRDYKRAADELETYLKLVPKAPDSERTRAAIKDLRSKQ
ncbi:MAG TPA: tetratricopeptide repeat protein [Pyrinomonadaceae bacterium]